MVKSWDEIAEEYNKKLLEASYRFQEVVMAATHEMEKRVLEWQKGVSVVVGEADAEDEAE